MAQSRVVDSSTFWRQRVSGTISHLQIAEVDLAKRELQISLSCVGDLLIR